MEKDLHYLVTRIINPRLNFVIASLADAKVRKFREDYADVKMYSAAGMAAKWLEDWRDELFRKYTTEDINSDPDRFLRDYKAVVDYIYRKSKGEWNNVLHELWLLGVEIERYLKGTVQMFSIGKLLDEYYSAKSELENLRERLNELGSKLSSESSEKLSLKERLDRIMEEYEGMKAKLRSYAVGGFAGGFVIGAVLVWYVLTHM